MKKNNKQNPDLREQRLQRKARRIFSIWAVLVVMVCVFTVPALAADDPLGIVNNLSDFIFSCIKAIGIIIRAGAWSRWA